MQIKEVAVHEEMTGPTGEPKTWSRRVAAERTGMSYAEIKAATNRAVDPLPSIIVGLGTGKRVVRKVIVAEVDAWLAREAARQASRR